jgi:toxin ParE1/3/4
MRRYEVVVSRLAEADIDQIVDYFISIDKEYAIKFYQNIRDHIEELCSFPKRGPIVPELDKKGIRDFHQLIEGNYRIIYSIHPKSVHILAVIDSRRNLEEILTDKIVDFLGDE